MYIPESTITIKGQTTIPIEIRKMLKLKPNTKILWVSLKPGEVAIVPASEKQKKGSWAESLYGKYKDDSIDGVQSLLDSRKEDIAMEEQGYL